MNARKVGTAVCLLGALLLGACTPAAPTPAMATQTVAPNSTAAPTQLPAAATPTPPPASPTPAPTATRQPTVPPKRTAAPSLTPTPSAQPTSTGAVGQEIPAVPLARVFIKEPGNYSRLASPVTIETTFIPGPGGRVRIELIGEDGLSLAREVFNYAGVNPDQRFGLRHALAFEIPGVSQAARIEVATIDWVGRTTALASVEVVLLALGESEINPSPEEHAPVVFQQPRLYQSIPAGTVTIRGFIRPLTTQPLIFDLVTEDGRVIGSRQLDLDPPADGRHQPFAVEIPVTVERYTPVLLTVRQAGERIPGSALLESLPFYLQPAEQEGG